MAHVYVDSNAAGAGTGADWANAYTTLAAALTGSAVAGNQFWVAQDHAESQGSAITLTSPGTEASPCTVICVNKAGTVPPVAADLRTTASITTTGAFGITVANGYTYFHGIIFNVGTGAVAASMAMGAVGVIFYKSCTFNLITTATASQFTFGASNGVNVITWKDCVLTLGNASQGIGVLSGDFKFIGGSYCATGSASTRIISSGTGRPGKISFTDVDMSNLTTDSFTLADATMVQLDVVNCKVGSGFSKAPSSIKRGSNVRIVNTSSADINYEASKYSYEGQHETSITVKRTGGFSDGTVGLSQKFTTSAAASAYWPFFGLPISAWHDSEGANITVTVEGVADPRHFTALPTNAEFWVDLDYFGTAANPLGVIKSGGPATPLTAGTAYAASTEAWDGGATARANTTVYAAGDVIKLASNAGRIFICTTGGTTDGSEPAGYASAVDGGSVTDGTATFKAGWRFKAVVTTSAAPQNKGPLYVTPYMAKASSVLYMDPKLTVA